MSSLSLISSRAADISIDVAVIAAIHYLHGRTMFHLISMTFYWQTSVPGPRVGEGRRKKDRGLLDNKDPQTLLTFASSLREEPRHRNVAQHALPSISSRLQCINNVRCSRKSCRCSTKLSPGAAELGQMPQMSHRGVDQRTWREQDVLTSFCKRSLSDYGSAVAPGRLISAWGSFALNPIKRHLLYC